MGFSWVMYVPSTMNNPTLISDMKNLVTAGTRGDGSLVCSLACEKEGESFQM